MVLREGGCPTLERNTISGQARRGRTPNPDLDPDPDPSLTGQARRGLLVCARGQGTLTDNEISDNLDANVEVRGELEKPVPEEQARGELEKKKRVYASLGLLVPLTTVRWLGLAIAGS